MPRVPALTLSGGKLSDFGGHKKAREYRIWVHPKNGGGDYFYSYKTIDAAKLGKKRHAREGRVETPLAVVYDPRYKKYREVIIDKKA